jgi:hypothetical protein
MKDAAMWVNDLILLATAGLVWRYVRATNQLVRSALNQTENTQRPFLALTLKEPEVGDHHLPRGWGLENQGYGPAMNIRHSEPAGNDGWVENVNPIKGGDFALVRNFDPGVMQHHAFTVEYESLSGTKYQTIVQWREGIKQTLFVKIAAH